VTYDQSMATAKETLKNLWTTTPPDGPAVDGPVHGDCAAGWRVGARDQESAFDDPAQHELLAEDLEEPQTPAQRRALKRVEVVRKECQRLQELLDGFLDYAKVRRLHLEPSDLNHQIEDVLEFFAPEAKAAGIEVVRYLIRTCRRNA